ncbi:T9SS sorting signal type C domain-containing protein [Flavobacterium gelatinilyticum]|uniref:T9SS sorting signal type C domain-containing protein n=1 Tax=Flavobacterium gelatinilyticum TaxID=3003260 RepID=UPI0024809AB9|nr:T9SS sorting signal type C domain-containing protein [Flavobacterium gelatinilyticum]
MIKKLLLTSVFLFLFSTFSFAQTLLTDNTAGNNKTWTVPAGVTAVTVEIWGAGGAGGGSQTDTRGGGGGGGGGYSYTTFSVLPGQNITYSVGRGGTGSTGDGGDGTASALRHTQSGINITANGGSGGNMRRGNGNGNNAALGGAGGTASNGSPNITGDSGVNGGTRGGNGGNAGNTLNTGGAGQLSDDGNPGNSPGGGGGGGEYGYVWWWGGYATSGGNGANGRVVISGCVRSSVTSVTGSSPICIGNTTTYSANGVVLGNGTGAWSSSNTNIATVNASGVVTAVSAGTANIIYTISGGCGGTASAQQAITVNPSHTITAASNQNACQNTAMTNITMTLGGGATGANVTGLPDGVTSSVTGNTLRISGTPIVTGQFNYTVTTTGNTCTAATTSGIIYVGIGNNVITYTNGTSGTICMNPEEYTTGSLTAPAGTYFNNVSFASYGTPTGNCGTFAINPSCHSSTSQSAVENALLGNSNTITIDASNAIFGDPCSTIQKRLYVTASYSQAICEGTIPGTITGSPPSGNGNYTYLWQMSSTSSTAGFTNAPGTNNMINYIPTTELTRNTWFRRIVTSGPGTCSNTSAVVLIKVNPKPTSVISGTTSICAGNGTTISIALTGTSPWNLTYTDGTTSTISTNITSSPYTFTVSPASTRTYTITALSDANCTAQAVNMTGNAAITVSTSPTITTQPQPVSICEGLNASFTVATSAASPSYQWEYSTNPAGPWIVTNGTTGVSGDNTSRLDITNVPAGYSGYYVHCVVTSNTCSTASDAVQLTVTPAPAAPIASVTTPATCAVNTGTITVSNPAPASGYNYSINGSAYTNTSGVFSGLAPASYTITVRNNSTGCISPAATIVINPAVSVVWNGSVNTNWNTAANWSSNLVPTAADCVEIPNTTNKPVISGTNNSFNAYTLSVGDRGELTVNGTNTLNVTNEVSVHTDGQLTFENNSSLYQSNPLATNTGNITYKRNTTPVNRYDFTFWSSPVTLASNFTLHDLSPDTLADKYFIYNPSSGWVIDYGGTSTKMVPGEGYNVRAPQTFDINSTAIYQASFVGVPTNGNVTVNPVGGKWNIVGNPYPSAIDGVKFIQNTDVGAVYFWTHANKPVYNPDSNTYKYATTDYTTFNLTGTAGPDFPGSVTPTGNIGAGQGFFVKSPSGNPIVFTNDMRVAGSNSNFYKTAQTAELERNRLWLNFTNTEGAFKQALVGYIEGASDSWDVNYDAVTLNGNNFIDFYSINEAKKLTIQGRALPFEESDIVPLGYRTTITGEFTIAIDHVDGIFNDQNVYLEDKLTGKIQDLKAGNYTFSTVIGTFSDRFTIRYTNKTLGNDDFETIEGGLLVSVKNKVIGVTSAKENIKEVNIYDISGRLLYSKNKVDSAELSISNLQSSNQVLLVKVTLENDAQVTRKIIFN